MYFDLHKNRMCYACQPGWTGTTCSASTTVLKISIFLFIIIFSLIFNLKDINSNLYVHCLVSTELSTRFFKSNFGCNSRFIFGKSHRREKV